MGDLHLKIYESILKENWEVKQNDNNVVDEEPEVGNEPDHNSAWKA